MDAVLDGGAVVAPPREKVGLRASPPVEAAPPRLDAGWEVALPVTDGAPPKENAGLGVESPPVEVAAGAAPNNGLDAGAAAVFWVADSAGLLLLPNRPPPDEGAVNAGGFAAPEVAPPNRPDDCVCATAGVVDDVAGVEDGVAEEPVFKAPNREGAFDPGGGPAGVVELLPNKEPPEGVAVAEEPAPAPNKLLEDFAAPAPPNNPLVAGCPGVVVLVVGFAAPKEKPDEVAGGVAAAVLPAVPKIEGL